MLCGVIKRLDCFNWEFIAGLGLWLGILGNLEFMQNMSF